MRPFRFFLERPKQAQRGKLAFAVIRTRTEGQSPDDAQPVPYLREPDGRWYVMPAGVITYIDSVQGQRIEAKPLPVSAAKQLEAMLEEGE